MKKIVFLFIFLLSSLTFSRNLNKDEVKYLNNKSQVVHRSFQEVTKKYERLLKIWPNVNVNKAGKIMQKYSEDLSFIQESVINIPVSYIYVTLEDNYITYRTYTAVDSFSDYMVQESKRLSKVLDSAIKECK